MVFLYKLSGQFKISNVCCGWIYCIESVDIILKNADFACDCRIGMLSLRQSLCVMPGLIK
jgi:hypothetical protein